MEWKSGRTGRKRTEDNFIYQKFFLAIKLFKQICWFCINHYRHDPVTKGKVDDVATLMVSLFQPNVRLSVNQVNFFCVVN